ncbi:MAG: hybrid sensor histidine kinase/response regulator [Bacteroidota bacterium]
MDNQSVDVSGALILIVDDTPQNVQVLSNLLHEAGYQVVAAFNGEDALEMVQDRNPDLILLDIMMPNMDGFETCKALRDDPQTESIPVIFLSALSDVEDKVKGLELGGQDYITKPFQNKEVLARVETHLRLYFLQKERNKIIEQLQRQKKQLEQLSKTKDEVLRIVSHDMRNPLNGVIGLSNMLRTEKEMIDEDDEDELLEAIEQSGEQMLQIVNELLDAARIESEELTIHRERVDLETFLDKVIHLQRPTARHKNIALETKLHTSAEVFIDRAKTAQILGNLISNAIKFTPEGGRVTIFADVVNAESTKVDISEPVDCLELKVQDTGIGIPKEFQSTLFEKYGKHNRRGTQGESSSGLGLWIIKQFVDGQQGTITVDSEEGKGTTFTIHIPLIKDEVET